MTIQKQIDALASLGKAEIGRGPKHPTTPNRGYAKLVRQHLEQYPFLKKHPDFVEFLEQYAGGRVFTPGGGLTPGFFHATIYGVGDWDFADECPSPVTSDGYYVFAVVETQPGNGDEDRVASFAFDTKEGAAGGVYAEAHGADEGDGPFQPFCTSFEEWLRLFVQARGWLLPSPKGEKHTPATGKL